MSYFILRNAFHGTKVRVRAALSDTGVSALLSRRQVRRARRALCCDDCTCSGFLGTRSGDRVRSVERVGHEDESWMFGHENQAGGCLLIQADDWRE